MHRSLTYNPRGRSAGPPPPPDADPYAVILKRVLTQGDVTTAEICRYLKGLGLPYSGDLEVSIAGNCVVAWGLSQAAADIMLRLLAEPAVRLYGCSVFLYVADGSMCSLPVATVPRAYRTPHWFPIAFSSSARYAP